MSKAWIEEALQKWGAMGYRCISAHPIEDRPWVLILEREHPD